MNTVVLEAESLELGIRHGRVDNETARPQIHFESRERAHFLILTYSKLFQFRRGVLCRRKLNGCALLSLRRSVEDWNADERFLFRRDLAAEEVSDPCQQ
jgi:hypothetical protein